MTSKLVFGLSREYTRYRPSGDQSDGSFGSGDLNTGFSLPGADSNCSNRFGAPSRSVAKRTACPVREQTGNMSTKGSKVSRVGSDPATSTAQRSTLPDVRSGFS